LVKEQNSLSLVLSFLVPLMNLQRKIYADYISKFLVLMNPLLQWTNCTLSCVYPDSISSISYVFLWIMTIGLKKLSSHAITASNVSLFSVRSNGTGISTHS
jgi:hypothetical protein